MRANKGERRLQIALLLALALALAGCKVQQPGRVETAFAEGFKRTVSVGGKKNVNPLPATAENIKAGQQNFSHYCMVARAGRTEYGGTICNSDVTARARTQLRRRAAVLRWAAEVGHRQRNFPVGYARFQGHPERG